MTTGDFIEVYDDAVPAPVCDALISAFERSPHAGRGRTGHGVDPRKKDCLDLCISQDPALAEPCAVLVEAAMACLVRYCETYRFMLMGHLSPQVIDPETGHRVEIEPESFDRLARPRLRELVGRLYRLGVLNLQKYARGRGGYHLWHSEIHPLDPLAETLHRVLLLQVYLDDVEDGGQTEFYYQRRVIEPRRGRLLIAPAGFTHTHKGHVPRSGDKHIVASWVLLQRAEWLFGGGEGQKRGLDAVTTLESRPSSAVRNHAAR